MGGVSRCYYANCIQICGLPLGRFSLASPAIQRYEWNVYFLLPPGPRGLTRPHIEMPLPYDRMIITFW